MAELTPEADRPLDLELLAAALRSDTSDIGVFLEVMANKLADILGPRAEIDRGGGRFRKDKPVSRIRVSLGNDLLEIARSRGTVTCQIAHRVRGIVLRTDEVDLPEWIDSLVRHLDDESRRSASTRAALEALLT